MEYDCGPILIVDENPPFRELVRIVLEDAGYATIERRQVRLRSWSPAKGDQLSSCSTSAYRESRGTRSADNSKKRLGRHLPIILVSGSRTDLHDRAAGLMIGADDYLIKPFAPDEFVASIGRLISRARAEQSTEQRPL